MTDRPCGYKDASAAIAEPSDQLQVSSDPAALATVPLIDHIVARYHAAHRRDLPELVRLAERAESVHDGAPETAAGLTNLLSQILGELTMHMQKEELMLFPRMRRGGSGLDHVIAVMLAEHDDHASHLRALRAATRNFTPPADACSTVRALYAGLAEFARDLPEHIALENDALFPRFRA
jgi:regulator of cell morphogenesis and NO signaling